MLALTNNFRPFLFTGVKCFFIAVVDIFEKSPDCRPMDINTLRGQFDTQLIKCYLAILCKTLLKPVLMGNQLGLAWPGTLTLCRKTARTPI